MSTSISQQESLTRSLKKKNRAKWVAGFAKSQILQHLRRLRFGHLRLIEGDEVHFLVKPRQLRLSPLPFMYMTHAFMEKSHLAAALVQAKPTC